MKAVSPAWHEAAMQLNFGDGLAPYFALHSIITTSGGSRTVEFTFDGELWTAKAYYQSSGIVHPGPQLPTGTEFQLDTMREFRIAIQRHGEEDPTGEQKLNAHVRPRWRGMEVERDDGTRMELELPGGLREGVNVRLAGSNVAATRYRYLLHAAARALDVNADYFRDPLPSSTVQDAERYVRIHRDASGPIHAREGPIASLAHLLEADREGYRKLVQQDSDEEGEQVPGYYHTVTLGPERITEAFPSHRMPKEVKHYLARHAEQMDDDNPLAHPKVGVSYQVSRWDSSVGVSDDDLEQLRDELDETLHAVLADAEVELRPEHGSYVTDSYFDAELGEHSRPPKLNLTEIRSEQENVVIRELAKTGGVSPVEGEILETLVTDGGRVSPADIAEEHGRNVGSVRRALRRIDDLVDREYGEVGLRSSYVAEMIHDAVDELRAAGSRLAEATGEALLAAERGLDETTSALRAWLARYDVEVDTYGEAIERIELGEMRSGGGAKPYVWVKQELRRGLELWCENRSADGFVNATVRFRFEGRGSQELPVGHPALLG
jgi:hypothetical protein